MASARATTNHDQIRRWVEERGGHPARVKGTGRGSDPGVLRIDYPGYSGEDTLEPIEWDEFFEWFERDKLAFLAQGGRSRFSKFVKRGRGAASKKASQKASASKKAASSKKTSSKRTAVASKKAPAKRSAASKKTATKKRATKTKRSAITTTDHDEIRNWVEARGGYPARVKRTGRGSDPGVLRIDYPGYSGQGTLERIEWEEFFEWFDRNGLAFLYQDTPRSKFSKLVSR